MRSKRSRFNTVVVIRDHSIPVSVIVEPRNGVRYSIAAKQMVLRVPAGSTGDDVNKWMEQMKQWATDITGQRPQILERFATKGYKTGDVLKVGKRQYTLVVHTSPNSGSSGRLKSGGIIELTLSDSATTTIRNKAIKTLLSRLVAQDFQQEIETRVFELNKRTFNRPIEGVHLKYNHTNWGSCSSKSNINLSTRLLFAPDDVQDYVIVHELAHLVEMNHSDRFWSLVETFMPDYRQKELWLKKHGKLCDF
jgi:predicted metal-dependent hydrolase